MAYTISALDSALKNYVDGERAALIANVVLGVDSLQRMKLQTGVKATTPIVLFTTPAVFQSGASCGFSADGDSEFSNRMLAPAPLKVQTQWCPETLLGTWAAHEVRVAAGTETMPFEQKIIDELSTNIKKELEKLIWQGDTVNGSGNLALLDGIVTLIAADETATLIPAAQILTAGASDTILDRAKACYMAMPDNMTGKGTLVMSVANYKDLCIKLMEQNLFHYDEKENAELSMILPGTTLKVQAVRGLEGINDIFVVNFDEIVYGCDLENDEEKFDFWYSQDNQVFRLNCKFIPSVNYAFPENIVVGHA